MRKISLGRRSFYVWSSKQGVIKVIDGNSEKAIELTERNYGGGAILEREIPKALNSLFKLKPFKPKPPKEKDPSEILMERITIS